ncbi:universal stress protein [Natrinema gelatinilyticum]|uniref:universal stress protein n=1 Tax=Natrinema gelatinilyticum TaxID=2961571 RepID=UPI0020C27AF7|nr:universal stress protein [Natrinema gelatinilyticum]
MKHGLVSLRESETHRELLAEAAEWCAGADGTLVVLWHLDEGEYDADVDTLESVERVERVDYDHSAIVEGAAVHATEFVESVLSETDIDPEIVVVVDSETTRAQHVLDTAVERTCDHVFIVGTSRSPAGKAVFGDFAQRVILNFDGYTTLVTE